MLALRMPAGRGVVVLELRMPVRVLELRTPVCACAQDACWTWRS